MRIEEEPEQSRIEEDHTIKWSTRKRHLVIKRPHESSTGAQVVTSSSGAQVVTRIEKEHVW